MGALGRCAAHALHCERPLRRAREQARPSADLVAPVVRESPADERIDLDALRR
jgi:hypothetical protein